MTIDLLSALFNSPAGASAAAASSGAAANARSALAASTPSATTATATSGATTSTQSTTGGTTSAQSSTDAAADRFLTLLVTQLRNQDPLNPLDNAEVTTQLAQLSTVTGINKLNDTVAAMSAQFAAGQYLQALPLVGHDVTVSGNKMALADGKASYGIAFSQPADQYTVTISDATGKVVRTIQTTGQQPTGVATFAWDGKADNGSACPDGTYTIAVTATAAGKPSTADALEIAHVTGIVPGPSGTLLSLGSLGYVDLSQVLQIN